MLFFFPVFLRICSNSSIVENLGSENTFLSSDKYPSARAISMRFFKDINPFCSKRAILSLAKGANISENCKSIFNYKKTGGKLEFKFTSCLKGAEKYLFHKSLFHNVCLF